jgi:hypothetical protein
LQPTQFRVENPLPYAAQRGMSSVQFLIDFTLTRRPKKTPPEDGVV